MNRSLIVLCVTAVVFAASKASASVTMTVDSGPWYQTNPAWFSAAKSDTVNGTFTNLRTGTYPGTTYVDPVDFLNNSTVYTAGPKLLYWLYYIPNETVANITANHLLQTKLVIDWGGDEYALAANHVNWVANDDSAWSSPIAGAIEDYNDGTNTGVIGQIRFSWGLMAGSVEAHRAAVLDAQTFARGEVLYHSTAGVDWEHTSLQVNVVPESVVPEPTTLIIWSLLGSFALGLGWWRKRKTV